MTKISWHLPIKTVSEANSSEHWGIKSKRHRQQQFFVRLSFQRNVANLGLPCEVTMTRLAPRTMDDDNLLTSLKYIRDEISECILPEKTGIYMTKRGKVKRIKGRADSDLRITWHYAQEKALIQGIRIDISY